MGTQWFTEFALIKRLDGFCLQIGIPEMDWATCDGFTFGIKDGSLHVQALRAYQPVHAVAVVLEEPQHKRWLSATPFLRVECLDADIPDNSFALVAGQITLIDGLSLE